MRPPVRTVSFIVVALNAEKTLPNLLSDLLAQTLPPDRLEAVLVDSGSADRTKAILTAFAADAPFTVKVLDNPKRWLASGCNLALQAASGDAVLRVDAHARIPADFLEKNLEAINRDEDIVGGSVQSAPPASDGSRSLSLSCR